MTATININIQKKYIYLTEIQYFMIDKVEL